MSRTKRYKGFTIEVSSSGDHAQVRWEGDHFATFHHHNAYEQAKAWIDMVGQNFPFEVKETGE